MQEIDPDGLFICHLTVTTAYFLLCSWNHSSVCTCVSAWTRSVGGQEISVHLSDCNVSLQKLMHADTLTSNAQWWQLLRFCIRVHVSKLLICSQVYLKGSMCPNHPPSLLLFSLFSILTQGFSFIWHVCWTFICCLLKSLIIPALPISLSLSLSLLCCSFKYSLEKCINLIHFSSTVKVTTRENKRGFSIFYLLLCHCQACAGLSSFGAEQGIASEERAVCPDPRTGGPSQNLKKTLQCREGKSALSAKEVAR